MAEPKKRGNPAWKKGVSGNPDGRPAKTTEKKTNKELRNEKFLQLVRKFYPHITKAVKAAVNILDDEKASESGKLRASALILTTYQQLLKDLYDKNYDLDDADPIQEDNKPKFSLKMLDGGLEDKQK